MTHQSFVEREGSNHLKRLGVFLDVVYALLFVRMLQYLPHSENMAWSDQRLGLLQLLISNGTECLRIMIGCGLTLIYWNLSIRYLSILVRTDRKHALLVILHMVFVCMFLYFAISDPALAGGPSSPALQSLSLAVAGFLGMAGWSYACKHGLVDEQVPAQNKGEISRRGLIEPLTALLNTPLAFLGPWFWTAGWFVIPVLVVAILKWRSGQSAKP